MHGVKPSDICNTLQPSSFMSHLIPYYYFVEERAIEKPPYAIFRLDIVHAWDFYCFD